MVRRERRSLQQQQQQQPQRAWEPVRKTEATTRGPELIATVAAEEARHVETTPAQEVLLSREAALQEEVLCKAAASSESTEAAADTCTEEEHELALAAAADIAAEVSSWLAPLAAVAPPPGLEGLGAGAPPQPFAPPPGLRCPPSAGLHDNEVEAEEDEAVQEEPPKPQAACQVRISGLPNKLLSEIMMEAILDQACLSDEVTHVSAKRSGVKGKTCGEALVSLASLAAAERCKIHFEGCQWDCSGATVVCEVLPIEGGESLEALAAGPQCAVEDEALAACVAQMAEAWAMCDDAFGLSWSVAPDLFAQELPEEAVQETSLSADSPAFVPISFVKDFGKFGLSLSKDAPVFVPSVAGHGKEIEGRKISDASTEVGESGESGESDEEDEQNRSSDSLLYTGLDAEAVAEPVFVAC